MTVTKLSSRGQIVIPEQTRKELGLKQGDCFKVIVVNGAIILEKIK